MASIHSTDWALRVMHIWCNLRVHKEAGMYPRKRFSTAKAAQLLTPMKKKGLTQCFGGYFNLTDHQEKHVSHNTVYNPLTLDLQLLVYVSLGQSADPN